MKTPSTQEEIDEQAARWTSKLDGGTLSAHDRLELHAWLDQDPTHRAAFEHYQMICDDTAEAMPALAEVSAIARPDPVIRRSARWIPVGVGLAASLTIAAIWFVPFLRKQQIVATVAAQRSIFSLPDGSKTELNAQTRLATDFRNGRRVVRLDAGEAYFAVAKDPEHPFIVATPHGVVTVTGTRFNVRLSSDGHPEITLLEGGIRFENAAARVKLVPGQQRTIDGDLRVLSESALEAVTAWREGRIVLNGLSLAQAAAAFASYHGKQIHIAPELGSTLMGGSYALDDLQGFFDALSDNALRLRVIRNDDSHVSIVRQ